MGIAACYRSGWHHNDEDIDNCICWSLYLSHSRDKFTPTAVKGGQSFSTAPFNSSLANAQPVSRIYGIDAFNLSYPLGTSSSYANELPGFQNASDSALSNMAQMDVVSSFPKCEFGFLETIDNIEVSTGGTPSLVGSNGRDQTADIIAADGTKADPVWTIFDGNPQANCTTGGYCFAAEFKFNPSAASARNRSSITLPDFEEYRKLGNVTGRGIVERLFQAVKVQDPAKLLSMTTPQTNISDFLNEAFLQDAFKEWTYDDLADPRLSQNSSQPAVSTTSSSYITFTLPAVQPIANCTLITPTYGDISGGLEGFTNWELDFIFPDLRPCGNSSKKGIPNPTTSVYLTAGGGFGYWSDRSSLTYHCLEYFAFAGHFEAYAHNIIQLSVVHCVPHLDRIDATIQLSYPGLRALRSPIYLQHHLSLVFISNPRPIHPPHPHSHRDPPPWHHNPRPIRPNILTLRPQYPH
ncbi:hypothetical protein MPH_11936 [Macrophomina phaseolina MS6]|uniref:Uncharacterized protein n=1 Tax=Macrophomina phaseolina (strain MS6) TaxID=1126212 RepID=K2R927_MACPH|nr:hypothetical protein MPH_11936 [Macrophomina phaseolina MS6]